MPHDKVVNIKGRPTIKSL